MSEQKVYDLNTREEIKCAKGHLPEPHRGFRMDDDFRLCLECGKWLCVHPIIGQWVRV